MHIHLKVISIIFKTKLIAQTKYRIDFTFNEFFCSRDKEFFTISMSFSTLPIRFKIRLQGGHSEGDFFDFLIFIPCPFFAI